MFRTLNLTSLTQAQALLAPCLNHPTYRIKNATCSKLSIAFSPLRHLIIAMTLSTMLITIWCSSSAGIAAEGATEVEEFGVGEIPCVRLYRCRAASSTMTNEGWGWTKPILIAHAQAVIPALPTPPMIMCSKVVQRKKERTGWKGEGGANRVNHQIPHTHKTHARSRGRRRREGGNSPRQ